MKTEELIKNKKGTIVDVRTPAEYRGGSVVGAVNIPLNEIPLRLDELKDLESPLILCCASGNRSGQATNYLSREGVECVNGGSWLEVNNLTSQEA
ncbi:rhodanese-like domain-containing protein [Antarcticibacterium sp. 1MA-6-2]|uniref:rhodanese-like domain-containing protein n=1 Tax=Antarcticibacterium sp. 1MA-6-2 TaxID=2908210 RepID=UPI001F284FCF|nr:rhodanese-like domain-containing protein [Antarcticibacterium sp. 1MA-6-2]UJH89652.1 rhodanese-like domain-containing protein [Antarcticibacterium sp. 1MA-6-2]